jgi:hypothetical protein
MHLIELEFANDFPEIHSFISSSRTRTSDDG